MGHHVRTLSDWNARVKSRDFIGLTYLIVNDDRVERALVREALLTYALRNLIEAENTREALGWLERRHVDVILVGRSMREMSGLQFASAVRTHIDGRRFRIPIIAVLSSDILWQKAFEAGVDGVVPMPIVPATLFERIRSAVPLVPAA